MNKKINDLNNWNFDNKFIRVLPKDPDEENYSRQVFKSAYSLVSPEQPTQPVLIAYSKEVAETLDLDESSCKGPQFLQAFSGLRPLNKMTPYATCYGGHQFGNWAGQLGDGRAINLGEIINSKNERWALQLKGAGPTPFSRSADGFAVLRSSIREFLCSEAMYHLGVPTTRALSLISTGDQVVRDMFYNGNPNQEPGAVVCRVSPSFTRFGHFELPASRGDLDLLRSLIDYTLETDFPHIGKASKESYLQLFREVSLRTAELMVHWQRVGFVHGVMNTDNMSILGLTIDYGPYGWLENYEPIWTPNTTDAQYKRYCYGNQPTIAKWNLVQLANALYPLIEDVDALKSILEEYSHHFESGYGKMMSNKIGLPTLKSEEGLTLLNKIPELLQLTETDMTLYYRKLAGLPLDDDNLKNNKKLIHSILETAFYMPEQFSNDILEAHFKWVLDYQNLFKKSDIQNNDRVGLMNATNPIYVLRNYLAQEGIELSEKGDHSRVNELLDVLRNPYTEQAGKEHFALKRPEWARHKPGCSTLSCSS